MTPQSARHGLFRPALLRSMTCGPAGEFERSHSLDGGSPAGRIAGSGGGEAMGAQSEANRIIASRSRRGIKQRPPSLGGAWMLHESLNA